MRLLVQSAMIFFGTLMAAGLLALGEPQVTRSVATQGGGQPDLLQGAWPEPMSAPSAR
jgi:hypothetical protein